MGVRISIDSLQLLTMSSDWFPKDISVLEAGIPYISRQYLDFYSDAHVTSDAHQTFI